MCRSSNGIGGSNGNAFLSSLPSISEVHSRINERYDGLTMKDSEGKRHPYVCVFCDEFILHEEERNNVTLKAMEKLRRIFSWNEIKDSRRTSEIEKYYSWNGERNGCGKDLDFLKGMALSPRAMLHSAGRGGGYVFKCCRRCKLNTTKENRFLPRHAILNRNYVGVVPDCLKCLNQVELAFLTPIKTYGFCFTWKGGKTNCMKGTLSFMKVKKNDVANGVATLNNLGLNKNVITLFTGYMTKAQKRRAQENSTIRVEKVTAALEWLIEHNDRWKNVNLAETMNQIESRKPVMLDRCLEVESENENIESMEVFSVFYPDGATTQTHGGFEKAEDFKEVVQEMASAGFDLEFQHNVEKKYFQGTDSDLLLDCCLLQFPYGIGGPSERRLLSDGSFDENSNLEEYFGHLSRKSDILFQEPMMQLVMYSMLSKSKLLRSSRLHLRGKTDAENLAEGLNKKDVISAINGRRMNRRYKGTQVSKLFLDAVDASGKALPHTNESTRCNRSKGEAMQHHFGMSSVFCTCTFDDENSFLMQVLADWEIDDNEDVSDLSDEELSKRAKFRRDLRLKYPGLASMNFEMQLEILMEEVIGWDMKKNCPNGKVGYFGKPYALFFAVEEQGRNTLHVHMMIWIEGYNQIQDAYFNGGTVVERSNAETLLKQYHEHCSTTEFFPKTTKAIITAFDHECTVPKKKRKVPVVVDDQGLRDLRNKQGYKDTNGKFAQCSHCFKIWTYEELVASCLLNYHDVRQAPMFDVHQDEEDNVTVKASVHKPRCLATCIEYQKADSTYCSPVASINAAYNHHVSCHVKSCFKCKKAGGKKRGHVCGPSCECRFRLPDRKRRRAEVFKADSEMHWYSFRGTYTERVLCQLIPKRNQYDLFQNVSCPAISESKFTCNSNVSVVTEGPCGQYNFKYHFKDTQEEDQAPYKDVERDIKKMADNRERVHQSDRAEALRLITRASFAHNRSNIISAPFASFFLRNSSRFFFSHEFAFCPLRDVVRVLNQQEIRGMLLFRSNENDDEDISFFENQALNYECRNDLLENCSLKEFTERYETKYIPRENDDLEVMPFKPDTGHFQHPSVLKRGNRKGQCSRGSKGREEPKRIQVSQWMFQDTADFKADILTCGEDEMNVAMESYAELVLCLLYPHRCKADLVSPNATKYKHVHKLQQVYGNDQQRQSNGQRPLVFSKENMEYLQNIQNARSNSLRYKVGDDDLTRVTEAYSCPNAEKNSKEEDEEEEEVVIEATYEDFADMIQEEEEEYLNTMFDDDPAMLPNQLNGFKFDALKNKGKNQCGWSTDIPTPSLRDTHFDNFVQSNVHGTNASASNENPYPSERPLHSVNDLVQLHLIRNRPKVPKTVWKDKSINVTSAVGTIKSIREWAKAAFRDDKCQIRAFEVIISSFLLTFYEESSDDATDATMSSTQIRSKYRQMKAALKRLRGLDQREHNLIMLLHGPGGSGKSTVMNTVKAYAKDFCEQLNHPYTDRTIVTTAMSGVAATLINGDTTHSVLGLNRDTIQEEEVLDFQDARLLIIDEISFASEKDFEKIHENLKVLMQHHYKRYGGLNIVFAGDYSQLEPVKREPIYKDNKECPLFHGSLNCYVELQGNWRFQDDPEYGETMRRFREGNPTIQDVYYLNERYNEEDMQQDITVATQTNKNRDAVNSAVFDDYTYVHGLNKPGQVLDSACVILMDDLMMTTSAKTYTAVDSNAVKKWFYQNCGESDCKTSDDRGRVDPVLKLYPDSPMMMTKNEDVGNGEANGTRVRVKGVRAKVGENAFPLTLENGTTIKALFSNQVDAIILEHENTEIATPIFELKSQSWTFNAKVKIGGIPEMLKMKGTQFAIVSNTCTTGHKLQGSSLDAMLVNDWHYASNWAYVVLSRVKTLEGLYLREELSEDLRKYEKPQEMKLMLKKFAESKIAVEYLDDSTYEELEKVGSCDYQPPLPGTPNLHDEVSF